MNSGDLKRYKHIKISKSNFFTITIRSLNCICSKSKNLTIFIVEHKITKAMSLISKYKHNYFYKKRHNDESGIVLDAQKIAQSYRSTAALGRPLSLFTHSCKHCLIAAFHKPNVERLFDSFNQYHSVLSEHPPSKSDICL